VAGVDFGYLHGRVTLSTGVINVLEWTMNSFSWTGSQVSLCSSVAAVTCVVDQSVPAGAHLGDSSLAHFVFAFFLFGE
jgi:hypothetical protein